MVTGRFPWFHFSLLLAGTTALAQPQTMSMSRGRFRGQSNHRPSLDRDYVL